MENAPVLRGALTKNSLAVQASHECKQPQPSDYFIERDGEKFAGTHLLLDVKGAQRLDDLSHIEAMMRQCVERSGATLLHIHLHPFTGGGVSGVAVLAESHISIHTWPEYGFAALDVFMCGNTRPEQTIPVIRAFLRPQEVILTEHRRGRKVIG